MVDRILEAHAVEQNVGVLRGKRAGLQLLRTARRDQSDTRSELRKAQEVSLALRQIFDLRGRYMGRDRLRLRRLGSPPPGNDDGTPRRRSPGEIHGDRLAH